MSDKLEALKQFSILVVEDEEGIRTRVMNALGYFLQRSLARAMGKRGMRFLKSTYPTLF